MSYAVSIERDPDGAWIARVPAVPGCHTYGRTLVQARRRIREALALWVDDADRASLDFEVHLAAELRREITGARTARGRSAAAQRDARAALRRAAHALSRSGLSLRDAAELLGVSHQRVQQLLAEPDDPARRSA